MKKLAIGYFILLFAANAFAINSDIPYCKAVEVRDQLVGFKCKTENYWGDYSVLGKTPEFVFEIVKKDGRLPIWKDPAGKRWAMPPKLWLSQADAMKSCREIGGILPTMMQLGLARGEAFYQAMAPGQHPFVMTIWTSDMDKERSDEYYQYGYYTNGIAGWPDYSNAWNMSQETKYGGQVVCLIKQ